MKRFITCPFLFSRRILFSLYFCSVRTEVRHQISSGAIGSWRKYAKHLKPLAKEFLKHVPDLRSRGVLIYPKSMNWDCDPDWDYEKALDEDDDEDEDEGLVMVDRKGSREATMSLLGGGSNDAEGVEIEEELEGDSGESEQEEEEEETEGEAEMRLKRSRRRRRRRNGGKRRRGRRKRSRRVPTDDESDDDTVQDDVEGQKTRTKKSPRSAFKVRTGGREDKKAVEKRLEDRVGVLMKKYNDPFGRDTGNDGKKGEVQGRGVNPYLEALKSKGLPAASVAMAVFSVTGRWEHRSASASMDYLMGLGHIFVHYQEMSLGASVFKDVLDVYREEGLLLPCHDRECGNEHPWSLDRVPQEGLLAPVGRCFIGSIHNTIIHNLF
jgi:hypothetical protein